MKNFKTVLLTLLFSIGFIFPSCKKDDLCKSGPSYRYFDIKGLETAVFKNDDITGFELFNALDTIVFSESVGIYMFYQADYHTAVSPSFSLMNSAMACLPTIPGYGGSKTEQLTHFSIITLNDFDSEHLANSAIEDLLEVQLGRLNEDNLPLLEYLANQTATIKYQDLSLKLTKAPELNSEFRFKIEVKLSTGESYEAENSPVYFKM